MGNTSVDQTTCTNGDWIVTFNDLPAGTYYIPVYSGPGAQGPYQMVVSASACAIDLLHDHCDQSVPQALAVGLSVTFIGNNTGATTNGDAVAGTTFDNGQPIVWESFTTTTCANVTVSYCGTSPSFISFYTTLVTTCPASDALVPNTSVDQTTCTNGDWIVTFNELPAGTYYIPVYSGPGAQGPYQIVASATVCASSLLHDHCDQSVPQALTIGSSVTFVGNNTGATTTGDAVAGTTFDNGQPIVWESFTTSTCASVTVSYCGTSPSFISFYTTLVTTCPASDALVPNTSVDQATCANGDWIVHFDFLTGGTYYIPIYSGPGAVGPYQVVVSAVSCGPGNNDFCDQAVPQALAVGASLTFTGDNTNATSLGDFVPTSSYAGAPVMWHAFTTTECADVRVSFCGQSPAWGTVFGFLSTDCSSDSIILFTTFNTDSCGDGNYTYYYHALAAGTYLVPVVLDAANNSVGPYSVDVAATLCIVGLNEWTEEAFALFPNPTDGALYMRSDGALGGCVIEVLDMTGRAVITRRYPVSSAGSVIVTNAGELAAGAYVVRLITDQGRTERRVVVR